MNDEEVLDFLEHFGVKGMKWGQRKASRQQNKALNKASRAKDLAERSAAIDAARKAVDSGKADKGYSKARAQHAKNKAELGSREARKILRTEAAKQNAVYTIATQPKDNKEAAKRFASSAAIGLVAYAILRP